MPPNAPSAPGTPTTHGRHRDVSDVPLTTCDGTLSSLSNVWDLDLTMQVNEDWSPRKLGYTLKANCLKLFRYCYYKQILFPALGEFSTEAKFLHSKWVRKPKADRDVLPVTRTKPHPLTAEERSQLLDLLSRILEKYKEDFQRRNPTATPNSPTRSSSLIVGQPIPIALPPRTTNGDPKRSRDGAFEDLPTSTKKPRSESACSKLDTTHMGPPATPISTLIQEPMLPPKSANTSFTSFASSIFSRVPNDASFASTQETVPDDSLKFQTQENPAFNIPQPDKHSSSNYNSSSFEKRVADVPEDEIIQAYDENRSDTEPHVEEELSQNLEEVCLRETELNQFETELRDQLRSIFPANNPALNDLHYCVYYEITRVFLHAGVPLSELNAPLSRQLEDYDTLWKFLKSLPPLKNRPFPDKSSAEAWKCALDPSKGGFYSVTLGGALRYNTAEPMNPIFKLELDALKLDKSHRLGRRFGHDRFFELCIPQLTGYKLPKGVKRLSEKLGEDWSRIIQEWLIDSKHNLLGRVWQPFFTKPVDRDRKSSKKGAKAKKAKPSGGDLTDRIFFFAVAGSGFATDENLVRNPVPLERHGIIPIEYLFNRIRPTRKNEGSTYLKLFSRTSLALSRTFATVVIPHEDFRFKDKDIMSGKEVMSDGAGRMSPGLGRKVMEKLGLTFLPSGFQGRIGEAKGLWIVDHTYTGNDDWIEIYPSQQKWKRSTKTGGESEDESHRTFEVLKHSGPLKSADLNTQLLPILLDRAAKPEDMRDAISNIMDQGLQRELDEIQAAMQNPESLRQWIKARNPNTDSRLKSQSIVYKGGLPTMTEERLNVFLDAGFNPQELGLMNTWARELFTNKCDEIKERLNITVGRSAYVYMVPDFWGVLEPNEVYIDFSSFVDSISGISSSVFGQDVLVARSPAHFISDVQKVKAVVKAELMGLKDVIVFSTKGNPSLASKLSGGDYDGDMAWVCWEPDIVDNFVNADVLPPINFMEENLISKDTRTYRDIIQGASNPTSAFLKASFQFNLQQSLLGICTNFKEKVCFNQESVDTVEARYLSQLLSDLVDQAKQGYIFGEEEWKIFKDRKIPPSLTLLEPDYKTDALKSDHIITHLKRAATAAVEKVLTDLATENRGSDIQWDEDLVAYYKECLELAEKHPEWKNLLTELNSKIIPMKAEWRTTFDRPDSPNSPEFTTVLVNFYERYHDVLPHENTPFTQALLPKSCSSELSAWSLLKASALFASCKRSYVPACVWWLAGKQLCALKARQIAKDGSAHQIIPRMYIIQRPDNSLIRKLVKGMDAQTMDDCASLAHVANAEDLAELED